MKSLLSILMLTFFLGEAYSTNTPFPSVNIKSLDGKTINTSELIKGDKITIISFWATWCSPCKKELDAFNELYEDWVNKYNVQLIAITIDDSRGLTKVPAMVKSKGWEFTVLADTKQELMQILNFPTVPQTYVLNKAGEIVHAHNRYNPGDEIELEHKLAELAKQ